MNRNNITKRKKSLVLLIILLAFSAFVKFALPGILNELGCYYFDRYQFSNNGSVNELIISEKYFRASYFLNSRNSTLIKIADALEDKVQILVALSSEKKVNQTYEDVLFYYSKLFKILDSDNTNGFDNFKKEKYVAPYLIAQYMQGDFNSFSSLFQNFKSKYCSPICYTIPFKIIIENGKYEQVLWVIDQCNSLIEQCNDEVMEKIYMSLIDSANNSLDSGE